MTSTLDTLRNNFQACLNATVDAYRNETGLLTTRILILMQTVHGLEESDDLPQMLAYLRQTELRFISRFHFNDLSPLYQNAIEDVEKTPYVASPATQECVICMEEFVDGEMLVHLTCHHIFHNNCIAAWFNFKTTCPSCRHDETPLAKQIKFIELFLNLKTASLELRRAQRADVLNRFRAVLGPEFVEFI